MHKAGVGGVVGSQDEADDEAVVACTSPSCYIMTKEKEEKGKRGRKKRGERREKRGMMDKSEIEG